MLAIRKYVPQAGILTGYQVIELDFSKGVLIRRVKAADLLTDVAALGQAKYLYIRLNSANLRDKELKKLFSKLNATNMQMFVSTDCQVADGLASILHLVKGVELNYTDCNVENIRRISLLAATRSLQLNIKFEQLSLTDDLMNFLPLFSELKFADINLYMHELGEIDSALPDNVKIRM